MKKLSFQLDDLQVESFETMGAAELRGTIQGHYTRPDLTDCGCEPTYNAGAAECYSYAVQCPDSYVPTNCTDSQPTNYWCDSCRDSVTACG